MHSRIVFLTGIERLHLTLTEIIGIQQMTNKDDPIQLIMKYSINNAINSATDYTQHEFFWTHNIQKSSGTILSNIIHIIYPIY